MATDVDDAGALGLLLYYVQQGKANLLAAVCDSVNAYGAGCIDALNNYYGCPGVPVGTYKGEEPEGRDLGGGEDGSLYNKYIVENYETELTDGSLAEDAVDVYRRTLASQPDNSVTIVSVGYLTNLMDLMRSGPDEYSDLNGIDLIAQKVKLICVMGGQFPTSEGPEYNFRCDPTSAQYLVDYCPAPIMFTGYEIGIEIYTGDRRAEMPEDDPIRIAYDLYLAEPGYYVAPKVNGVQTRWSWDLTAVMYAVEGLNDKWTMARGDVEVLDTGVTVFTGNEETGARAYLIEKKAPEEIAAYLNQILIDLSESFAAEG